MRVECASDVGEFVVNFSSEPLLQLINATATDFPRTVSEFDTAGIEREPGRSARPPRVAAAHVALECRSHTTLHRAGRPRCIAHRVGTSGRRLRGAGRAVSVDHGSGRRPAPRASSQPSRLTYAV
ncbi:flavin reductase [Streptomyces hyaluromycini]|uniref:Flavin reductase n=1 Tax=Streptomyces hyaluromycini TaxID=1377993 RepID=A0ABV1WZJ3_9ACTN